MSKGKTASAESLLANDWDGHAGTIPKSSALAAEVLKDYGYSTSAFGEWHNTPALETTAAGPFENWPTNMDERLGRPFDTSLAKKGGALPAPVQPVLLAAALSDRRNS
jgi:arylsulfatase A-like enzyme